MKRALGVDLGDVRIGIAISDELGMLAHPVATLKADAGQPASALVAKMADEKGVETIVIGIPRNMDGSHGAASQKCRAVADELEALGRFKIVRWDERLTTVAAQRALHESGRNAKKSRAVIDQVAAQMLLQGWLDSQAMGI